MTNGEGAIWIEAIEVQGILLSLSLDEPEWTRLVYETFDDVGSPENWRLPTSLARVLMQPDEAGNRSLWVPGNVPPVRLAADGLSDQVVEADLLLQGSTAQIALCHSEAGEYRVVFEDSGTVTLLRSGVGLAEAQAHSDLRPNQRVKVRVEVLQSNLRVWVEGQQILQAADPTPLPGGALVLFPTAGSGFRVDNVEIRVPSSGLTPTPSPGNLGLMSPTVIISHPTIGTTTKVAHGMAGDRSVYVNGAPFFVDGQPLQGEAAWSIDGTRLAVTNWRKGNVIEIVRADGTHARTIVVNGAFWSMEALDWSPDGSRIAFNAYPEGIFYLNVDTCQNPCNPTFVTNGLVNEAYQPTWSPDGQWLAYYDETSPDPGTLNTGIWITDLNGNNTRSISPLTGPGFYHSPSWSPVAGNLVAAVYSEHWMRSHLVLLDIDNPSNIEVLVTSPDGVDVEEPEWSPDGMEIMFSRYLQDDGSRDVYTIGANGPGLSLTIPGGTGGVSWAWMDQTPGPTPDNDCSDNTLDVIPESLFQERGLTQEAEDMKAVATLAGLYLHEGPTLNARRLGTPVPWGSNVTVQHRMAFAQTAFPDQVWYSIQYSGQSGWIAARIEDKSYLEGVDADSDACSQLDAPSTLTFTYDRMSAAKYAIAHAYRNSGETTGYPNAGFSRVTNRIAPGTLIDGTLIPYVGEIPYAEFIYPSLTGELGATGSASFTSESIWTGGHAMTRNPVSNQIPCTNDNDATAGWRYCADETSDRMSLPWQSHPGLLTYYAGGITPASGRYTFFTARDVNGNPIIDRTTVQPIIGTVRDGFDGLGVADNAQIFFDLFIRTDSSSELRFNGIDQYEIGDYVYINRGFDNPLGHGFLIVGWGPVTSCPTALQTVYTFESSIQTTRLLESYTDTSPVVPYVSDFSGPRDGVQLQLPRPRPFYCALYPNPDSGPQGRFVVDDGFGFFKLPDMRSVVTDDLYISPQWDWNN